MKVFVFLPPSGPTIYVEAELDETVTKSSAHYVRHVWLSFLFTKDDSNSEERSVVLKPEQCHNNKNIAIGSFRRRRRRWCRWCRRRRARARWCRCLSPLLLFQRPARALSHSKRNYLGGCQVAELKELIFEAHPNKVEIKKQVLSFKGKKMDEDAALRRATRDNIGGKRPNERLFSKKKKKKKERGRRSQASIGSYGMGPDPMLRNQSIICADH